MLTTKLKLRWLVAVLLLAVAVPLQAQLVSNNNDDEVNRVDRSSAGAYRPGQLIVKFKTDSRVKAKRNTKGRLQSMSVSAVDEVMKAMCITEATELMPLTGAIENRAPRRAKALSGRTVIEPDLSTLYCLKFDPESAVTVEEAVEQFKALDEVEYAEPNYLVFIQSTGTEDLLSYISEPMYSQQWGLNAIKLPQLWVKDKVETERPVIAILDTGVDINHPDLAANIWTNALEVNGANYTDDDANGYVDDVHGWDFVAGTAIIGNGMDRNGHGTHCAGIAAAVGNNGIGIAGANPDAYILPIKVMGDDGTGDIATICRGIDYATACHAHVLSMSFGGPNSAAEYQALCKTLTSYAVLVGAAGNSGYSINDYKPDIPTPSFPGAYDIVVGVMASDANGQRAGFSNYDPDGPFFSRYNMDKAFSADVTWNDELMWNYDVMAPGVGIMSTYLNGGYKALNGTSMATPMVAGAVSRILQAKGYDYARDYGLIGDLAMAKDGGITDLAVFDAQKAASYDETNRQVVLALTALEIDDSAGDGDGRFDAGETINIWPTIRSLWGHAENIRISIEPYDENTPTDAIEVLDNNVDFGWSLNSRGSFKSQNPIRVRVNDNAYDGMRLPYKIVITSDNLLAGVAQEHVFEVENGVELGGVINEDMTLYPNKHYIVTKNIAIPQGKTLTIMPGTKLEFNEGCYIKNEGKLIANGKPDSLIYMTTRYENGSWGGIGCHGPGAANKLTIYTNSDTSLFTLVQTDITPIVLSQSVYRYVPSNWSGKTYFTIAPYMENFHRELWEDDNKIWMNDKLDLATAPEFITPIVNMLIQEYRDSLNSYPVVQSSDFPTRKSFDLNGVIERCMMRTNPIDTITYCVLENLRSSTPSPLNLYIKDSEISISKQSGSGFVLFGYFWGRCLNLTSNGECVSWGLPSLEKTRNSYFNVVNYITWRDNCPYSLLKSHNMIYSGGGGVKYYQGPGELYYMVGSDSGIATDHADFPSWLGASKEKTVRPYVYDSMNPNVDCFTTVDLSNMPTRPYREAHGIVWKVVVDGFDAQDEFDQLPPLGVGRHKFEVYYNRDDMDTTFTPSVSMGLREPYTQTPIAEGGYWTVKDSASVYTVFLNITGKTNCDGLNRICVTGGKDYDHFDIPNEKYRFNVLVQAAGSMATGFAAEPGLGKVTLTWNNDNNDFDDAMGFNVYRFQINENNDTINKLRVNEMIIDIADTAFVDYNVTAGETYYYYYKVLSTDLKEYDISNVVAATPLTSVKGDANGSMAVDVADVVTIVSHLSQQDPQPFIFDAADVNEDGEINILDIVGVINIIAHPNATSMAIDELNAVYSIEDGILYVDSPVALGGVQVMVSADEDANLRTLEALDGMERVWLQVDETTRLLLAYSMSGKFIPAGKTALLDLNGCDMKDLVLSDTHGRNIFLMLADVPTGVSDITTAAPVKSGIYDMMGRKLANTAAALGRLQPGIYIVDGVKTVKK